MINKICKKLPPDIHFLILGEGPEVDNIKKIESELDNVHYLGYKNHDQTISLIKGSDVLIQPSLSEGISSTILEAMACKTPIIASNVGGNMELLEDQKSGILIDPTDYEKYCVKIIELVSNSELRNSIAKSAFNTVKKYDWEIVGNQYLELYNSVLQNLG